MPANKWLTPLFHLTQGGFHLSHKGSCSEIQVTSDAKRGHALCSIAMPPVSSKQVLTPTGALITLDYWALEGRQANCLGENNRKNVVCLTCENLM